MLCEFSSTKEQQFKIRVIYETHKYEIENAPKNPGGVIKKCIKKTCYHSQGTCVIDKEKFLTDLYEFVEKKEWGRIKTIMIGWEKMLYNDFQNYIKNLEYEKEQKIEYEKEARKAFYIWKTGQSYKYKDVYDDDDDDLPAHERFEKWLSDKVFVFRDQHFCGKESWGIFNI